MRFIPGDRVRALDDFTDGPNVVAHMGDYGTVEHVDNDGIDGTQHGVTVRFDKSGRALTVDGDDLRPYFIHTDRLRHVMAAEGGTLVAGDYPRADGTPDYGVWFADVVAWEHGESRVPDCDRCVVEDGALGETEFGTTFHVVRPDDIPARFR